MAQAVAADLVPEVSRLAELVRGASRVLFVTGAGISADSGLPTYRGVGGLYEVDATEEGLPIEVALSGETMARAPALCWKYIHQIEAACRGAQPNEGHRAIAALERHADAVVVLTQNVDGFHAVAGSSRVVAIHGDIHDIDCTGCEATRRVVDYAELSPLPRCPACGEVERPRVVLFGEMLPERAVATLMAEEARGFDLVVAVGTTAGFPYIAGQVVRAAASGVPTVEINPARTVLSDLVSLRIAARAEPTLASLRERLDAG